MALLLRQSGHRVVFALEGGYDAWEHAGFPVEFRTVEHAPTA